METSRFSEAFVCLTVPSCQWSKQALAALLSVLKIFELVCFFSILLLATAPVSDICLRARFEAGLEKLGRIGPVLCWSCSRKSMVEMLEIRKKGLNRGLNIFVVAKFLILLNAFSLGETKMH